jgi:predicted porin
MKSKLKWAALVAAATALPAYAQSSVTVYGVIDTGLEYLNNANAAGDSLTRMPSVTGGLVPSRWGMRGSEDLGGGLRAVYTLEGGFNPDNAAFGQGGRLFGRQAWLGLAGSWGTVAFGRTYSMLFYSMLNADVMGPSIYAAGSFDAYLPNARHDNSVQYMGRFGEFTVGATYSLGRDAASSGGPAATNCPGELANDSSACRQWSALAKYDSPKWGAAVAYDTMNGGPNAAFGLNSSSKSDERLSVNGYVMVTTVKVGGGLLRRDNEGSTLPRSDLWYFGASVPFAKTFVFDGQVLHYDLKDSSNDANMIAVRLVDNLSRRTAVYVTAGYIDNRDNSAISVSGSAGTVGTGLSQTGVMVGMRHSF